MLSLDAGQLAAVALTSKYAKWVFTVTDKNAVVHYFSTGTIAGITDDIIITDFSGIELRRNQSESGIIAPSNVNFTISNANNTLTFSDYRGGNVLIELYISTDAADTKIAGWTFRIKTAEPGYQKIRIVAEDFLQYYLRGDYPNTRVVSDIFPSNRTYEDHDGKSVCVPVSFGTAYIPLRDVYIDGSVTVSGITIAAVASASGARCKFTDSDNGLAVIEQGRTITVSGFTDPANNGTFVVLSVAAGEIEVDIDAGLVNEAAGDAVTITHGSGYVMLGTPGALTYTVTKVRSPRALGQKSEWDSGSYTFTQYTKADEDAVDWRVFQAIIFDLDMDGTADSPGYFQVPQTAMVYDPLVQLTRSDTASMTSPADVIAFVLEDMGVPSAMIDDGVGGSFAAAKATYVTWSLEFNGAFWYKEPRERVLSKLLTMCHSCLDVGETIKLRVLSKTSKKTFTAADILISAGIGDGSFQYRDIASDNYSDSGYVLWQQTGEPQDKFLKVLVAADAAANVISGEVLECPFVQNSEDVQRIGRLFYQRKLLKEAEVSFASKGTNIALQPDDVVTINADNYGGNYALLVDGIRINKDLSLQFTFSKYTSAFDDWGDLAPAALTIPTDDTLYAWQPTVSGPQSANDIGRSCFDTWGKEYLTMGTVANQGAFYDLQKALNQVKQAGGGAIYLLNGTYTLSDVIYTPAVNFEIIGQSKSGVVLNSAHDKTAFKFPTAWANTAKLSNFTIDSNNDAATKIIDLTGANPGTLELLDLILLLSGTSTTPIDTGIYTEYNINLRIYNTYIKDGTYAIYVNGTNYPYAYGDFIIDKGCKFENQLYPIYIDHSVKRFRVFNSQVIDARKYLFYLADGANPIDEFECSNNIMKFKAAAVGDNSDLAWLSGVKKVILIGNNIEASPTDADKTHSAIHLDLVDNAIVTGNTIKSNVTTTGAIAGIWLSTVNKSNIQGNNITIDNDDATANHYGIYMSTADGNTITGNNIDMVNSNAKDFGIYLPAGCDNNKGQDNKLYRCGVQISDAGTGNLINKSGGGTF